MSSLYNLDASILALLENGFNESCVDPATGEIDEAKAAEYLETLPIERDKKLEAYGIVIKNYNADIEAIKTEQANLTARRQAKEKQVERLKNAVRNSLFAFNQPKFETPKVAYSFRKSETVEVLDGFVEYAQNAGLDDLITYKEPLPNKTAIKQAIKGVAVIEGASLVINQNLQIK